MKQLTFAPARFTYVAAMSDQPTSRRPPVPCPKELNMADYSDCIRNLRETASVLDDVADKRHDKRAELREVVDFLEATVTRLGKGQGS